MSAAVVPMFDPQGVLRDVPFEKVKEAQSNGAQIGVRFADPSGITRYAPASKLEEVAKNGGKIMPIQEQAAPKAGFWKTYFGDFNMPGGVSPYPGMDVGQKQAIATQSAAEDAKRKEEGHGLPYRAVAGVVGAVAPVAGMEQSAREGDVGGVFGHMAAGQTMAAAPLVAEGVSKAVPAVSEAVHPYVAPVVNAAKKTADVATFERASKIYEAWKGVPEEIKAKVAASKPVYPGAPLPEHPGVFPGASLPEKPPPELINANALTEGGKPAPVAPAAGLGKIPVRPTYPGAPRPVMPPEVAQAAPLGQVPKTGALPASQTGEALASVPVKEQAIETPKPTPTPKAVGELLEKSMGGAPLKSNVPLKYQTSGELPKDFMPVKSSAVRGYKYDPEAQEMSVITRDGSGHIYGDVSPEQAKSFAENPSAGKAWADLRNSSSAKVAKIVNGNRVAVKPPSSLGSASPTDVPDDDLLPQLQKSLERARKLRAN